MKLKNSICVDTLKTKMEPESIRNLEEEYKKRNCTILTDLKTIKLSKDKIKYICACGEEKEKLKTDFLKNKECRTCKTLKFKSTIVDETFDGFIPDDSDTEQWKKIQGGWISSEGNALNVYGKVMKLDSAGRYNFRENKDYVQRHMAKAFRIDDYDKLIDQTFCVTKIDKDLPYSLTNIKVVKRSTISEMNGMKSHNSLRFKEQKMISDTDFKEEDNEYRTVVELPSHLIYKNGEICNGTRFLSFSSSGKYRSLCTKLNTYKVHRLICYAFHPIAERPTLSDYDDLQVNHKDGNTFNNHADNLEWVTSSENMLHAYSTNLNKSKRKVIQYIKETNTYTEYDSVAEASRKTEEPEQRIRDICNGKSNSKALFDWSWENNDETEEYSKKFSHK